MALAGPPQIRLFGLDDGLETDTAAEQLVVVSGVLRNRIPQTTNKIK
jgi:hypothetical protein